jgi:hypothetical protein
MGGFYWSASKAQQKQAEIVGKLWLVAGDHNLVRRAMVECSGGRGSARLSEVLAYILKHRRPIA